MVKSNVKGMHGRILATLPANSLFKGQPVENLANVVRVVAEGYSGWVILKQGGSVMYMAPPPRLAETPAGKHIQLACKATMDDGSYVQRILRRDLPPRMARQLDNCVAKRTACITAMVTVHCRTSLQRIAYGPECEWYISGIKADGSGEHWWAGGDALSIKFNAVANAAVTFGELGAFVMRDPHGGSTFDGIPHPLFFLMQESRRIHSLTLVQGDDQCEIGFVLKDNRGVHVVGCDDDDRFHDALTPQPGYGQLVSVVDRFGNLCFVVLLEHAFEASLDVPVDVTRALRTFYARHREMCTARRHLIAEYERLMSTE
ncbi:Aste57867_12117 [Aphanomyces stellatus]|uniref:Aste57867_12117 protein n=1 Tax=Aphanomyces stellatus TaxID=120398 RepID=A0A485KUP0_9STRA|nr:hypothetical protein As57867_012072 [Aphanomyces stellatus]VFT88971.1 Aste57867_12117 [Aphanomyces stellatus]